ncbi:MAG TPA: hypothetical protein VFG68_02195 [Fimbriiglobus sp.]|nr:hypothetical protein [Fimbriiglobus sp.]
MSIKPVLTKGCLLFSLTLTTAALGLTRPGVTAPPGPVRVAVRLDNPIEAAIDKILVAAVCLLADNESVVVVGGKFPDPVAESIMSAQPAGAIVNLRTKAVRPFTNRHRVRVNSLACSADRIVTVCTRRDPFVRLWDIKAGKPLEPITLPQPAEKDDSDFEVATFHRSRKVAVTLRDRISIFDPTGREERIDLTTDYLTGSIPAAPVISPDDKYLACSNTHDQVIVWDVAAKKVLYAAALLPEGEDPTKWHLGGLHFIRTGTQLIAARWGKEPEVPRGTAEEKVPAERRGLFLIDVAKQETIPLGMGGQVDTMHFAIHPSEDWIVTAGSAYPAKPVPGQPDATVGELRVYHYPTRKLVHKVQFDFEGFQPMWVKFTPDGKKLVAVSANGKVMAWDFTPVKP